MSRKLEVGDRVACRFYNTPEKRFYGQAWVAKITSIDTVQTHNEGEETPWYIRGQTEIRYTVEKKDGSSSQLIRKEILHRI